MTFPSIGTPGWVLGACSRLTQGSMPSQPSCVVSSSAKSVHSMTTKFLLALAVPAAALELPKLPSVSLPHGPVSFETRLRCARNANQLAQLQYPRGRPPRRASLLTNSFEIKREPPKEPRAHAAAADTGSCSQHPALRLREMIQRAARARRRAGNRLLTTSSFEIKSEAPEPRAHAAAADTADK